MTLQTASRDWPLTFIPKATFRLTSSCLGAKELHVPSLRGNVPFTTLEHKETQELSLEA